MENKPVVSGNTGYSCVAFCVQQWQILPYQWSLQPCHRCQTCEGQSSTPFGYNRSISIFHGRCNPLVVQLHVFGELFGQFGIATIVAKWQNDKCRSKFIDRLSCFNASAIPSASSIRLLKTIETHLARKQIVRMFLITFHQHIHATVITVYNADFLYDCLFSVFLQAKS